MIIFVKSDHTLTIFLCPRALLKIYREFSMIICSCSRLGLVSLAYLWQRDQADLLQEMINAGVKAILIKVASMGGTIFVLYIILCNTY